MPNLLSTWKSPKGEAEHMLADQASSRSIIDLSPRARQVSFWATVIALASYVPYFAALARYLAAGFSPPVPKMTRIVASVSVFAGAPAMGVQVASLASQSRPETKVPARLSTVFMLIFAGSAVSTRILQLIVLGGKRAGTSQLDLYEENSLANSIEMFAWGPCQGLALLFASRMFATGGLVGWARRLFALAGILESAGGSITLLGKLLSVSSLQSLGRLVCLPAWVILQPAAEAVTVWLLRGRGRPSEGLPARPVSG
jgi:hypothetical protein